MTTTALDLRTTAEAYLAMVRAGELGPEDRVELLEGVISPVPSSLPEHAALSNEVADVLRTVFAAAGVAVRVQSPLLAGSRSVPEPDVAVVPGRQRDYLAVHPDRALLVVEIAQSSIAADRITKAAIYAAAGVQEYWIVDLAADAVEVMVAPQRSAGRWGRRTRAARGEVLEPSAAAGGRVEVAALLPLPPG